MTTTTETLGYVPAAPAKPRLSVRAGRFIHAIADWRQKRRDLAKLARLDPRLVTDMGFDPAAIHEAVRNSWDEVEPGRYHSYDRV